MGNLFNGNFGNTVPDNLFAEGKHPVDVKGVTLKSGQGILARGTVLGVIGLTAAAAVAGTNTGNGTVGTVTAGKGAKAGTYTLKCITKVSNAGVFSVIGPDGVRYADATVAVAYIGPIKFTIADGATDFEVGDSFTVVVSPATEIAYKVNSANADNSAFADCILTDTVDTTDGDVVATAYTSGSFNRAALIYGGTDTAAKHEAALREKGIILKGVVPYNQ